MIGFLDGDGLAYLACPPRVKDEDKVYEADDNGKIVRRMEEHTAEEDKAYFKTCVQRLNFLLKDIKEKFFLDEMFVAIKGGGVNHRFVVFPEYKLERATKTKHRNKFVPALVEYLLSKEVSEKWNVVAAHGRESDDLLRIWATQAQQAEEEYMIISGDKDLNCIPGLHGDLNAMKKNSTRDLVFEMPEIPAYYVEMLQLLMGDRTDGIPGIPKCGPKTAEKILAGCETKEAMQEAVMQKYMDYYEDMWYPELLSNGKLLYVQKAEHDYFSLQDWECVQEALKFNPKWRTYEAAPLEGQLTYVEALREYVSGADSIADALEFGRIDPVVPHDQGERMDPEEIATEVPDVEIRSLPPKLQIPIRSGPKTEAARLVSKMPTETKVVPKLRIPPKFNPAGRTCVQNIPERLEAQNQQKLPPRLKK